jgi:high-affinity iron transporter
VWQSLLITFREGLESFLIVGVILAYLRKTGRPQLARGVYIGIALSVLVSLLGGYGWYRWRTSETGGPNEPLFEGIAALVAAVLVGGLLWQTMRAGKHLKKEIEARVDRAAASAASGRAIAGVAAVTTLLIAREGLEMVLFLGTQAFANQSDSARPMVIGGLLGAAAAAVIAAVWSRYSHRLQIGVVLKVTSIFLAIFLVQLLVYGIHELAESGVIKGSQAFHDATERFGPDGDIGQLLVLSLAAAPILYLILIRLSGKRPPPAATASADRLVG